MAVCFVDFFHFPPFYLDSLIASLPDGDAAIGALGSAAMPTAQSLHDFVGKECSVHPSMALAFSTASLSSQKMCYRLCFTSSTNSDAISSSKHFNIAGLNFPKLHVHLSKALVLRGRPGDL